MRVLNNEEKTNKIKERPKGECNEVKLKKDVMCGGYRYNGILIHKGYPSYNAKQCWIMDCKDQYRYFGTLKDVKQYIATGKYNGQ